MAAPRRPDPGDLDSLRIEALADANQWFAIAAIAKASADHVDQALGNLAPHSSGAEAFTWLWSLFAHEGVVTNDASWASLNLMPTTIAVPDALHEAVVAFIAGPEAGTLAGQHDGRIALLERLPTKLQKTAARATLDNALASDDVPPSKVVWIASYKIAERLTKADRALITRAAFESVAVATASERVHMLNNLGDPISADETEVLTVAVIDALDSPTLDGEDITDIHVAWNRLPVPSRRRIVAGPFTLKPDVRRQVLTLGLVERMGVDAVLDVLLPHLADDATDVAAETSADILNDLVAHIELSAASDLLVRAHDGVDPDMLPQARLALITRLDEYKFEDERRATALAALVMCVITKGGEASIHDLVSRTQPGDLTPASVGLDLRPTWSPVATGILLSQYINEGGTQPDLASDEAQAARYGDAQNTLDAIADPAAREAVFATVLADGSISTELLMYVQDNPELAPAVIAAGYIDNLVPWLEQTELDADTGTTQMLVDIIRLAPDDDTAARALALLTATLNERAITWTGNLDEAVVSALTVRPDLLCVFTLDQVRTLGGPTAAAAPSSRLERLLPAALDAGLADWTTDAVDAVSLLTTGSKVLHPFAARWMELSPPSQEWVDLCVARNDSYRKPSPYAPVLKSYAATLAKLAQDQTRQSGERIADLELCATADATTAREAALAILRADGEQDPQREAAARVVASSDGTHEDAELLSRLVEDELNDDIARLLDTALHRIKSGDIGEAVRNLLTLVGSTHESSSVEVNVVLPYPQWHAVFIAHVDDTTAARLSTAKNFLGELNSLAEQIVETALIAFWTERNVKDDAAKATKVLANAAGKPKLGTVIIQQDLVEEFGWFNAAAVLRQYRDEHSARTGTTEPLVVSDGDATFALVLMRGIVDGWILSMSGRTLNTTAVVAPTA